MVTLVEGESLFNDATALIAYRAALVAVATGTFVLVDGSIGNFVIAAIGGILIGCRRRPRHGRRSCAGSTTRRSRSSCRC